VTIRPIFAWYDLWVGVFVDRPKQRVYVFPVPCIGLVISWGGGVTRGSLLDRVLAWLIVRWRTRQ
jgi:hypothetical protein